MFIQNVSMEDIKNGYHYDAGFNSMLIQILDPGMEFPIPKHEFRSIHQFEFLDIELSGFTNNGDGQWTDMSEFAIADNQAKELASLLVNAYDNGMNVIVHCHAGVSRSGAVAEVGISIGFNDTGDFRAPNLTVKHMLEGHLGLTVDLEEVPFMVQNGERKPMVQYAPVNHPGYLW